MNVGSKCCITWNDFRPTHSWGVYLHYRILETCSPGIIYIICHRVLCHPSEHGISSIMKPLLANAQITKLYELTESEVSELTSWTLDETAFVIMKRQGSRGITIGSSQRQLICINGSYPYSLSWQTKCSKVAAMDIVTVEFHQDTWNRHLMLWFLSGDIRSNAISNLELWWSCRQLYSELVCLSAHTISDICWRAHTLIVDANKKTLCSRNKVRTA